MWLDEPTSQVEGSAQNIWFSVLEGANLPAQGGPMCWCPNGPHKSVSAPLISLSGQIIDGFHIGCNGDLGRKLPLWDIIFCLIPPL